MDNNINNKTSPNQMRIFMKRIREGRYTPNAYKETTKHELSMRDLLKITRTRKLNEDVEGEDDTDKKAQNKKTVYDQSNEEEKFRNFFNDMNVNIKFIDLEIYDNLVFWGGTVDGVIQFIYKVTPDEKTSGVEFNYLEDFSEDNPDNDKIVKKIESYYDSFYKYWRNNILEK
jgi:hypothetical protein